MVNAVYDHIIATIVIGAVFVGAVVVLPAMSFINIQAVDQQQLRNTALNVFNAMLLDTGLGVNGTRLTTNWGSMDPFDVNNVTRFGLASAQDSTFYVLDPDKVQRLVEGNPLNYINYNRARELLGLQGYGFCLRIIPPFNVTVLEITPPDITLSYKVKVLYLNGGPIPNAEASATIVYTSGDEFNITMSHPPQANALGIIEDTVRLSFKPRYVMVILRVTVADVATLVVTFGSTPANYIAKINMVGDNIILTMPDGNETPRPNRNILEIFAFESQGSLTSLYTGTKTGTDSKLNYGWGSNWRIWERPFPSLHSQDPVILVFNIWTVPPNAPPGEGGKQEVIVAGPYQNLLGYTVFQYGPSPKSSGAAVRIQRSVVISGMTYTAELLLWKESP
jgi:hypothetical protein